jgi:drug/metabolite transporter (DMT)-like permease
MVKPGLRFRADAMLLLAALLWGSAFIPQRIAAQAGIGAFLFNGLRFLLGGLVLLPWIRSFRPSRTAGPVAARDMLRWASIAGALLVGASVCQQAGMQYTTAGNAAFLTGLYVVFVPVVMFAGWRNRIGWPTWAGALVATAGVYLLGVDGQFTIHLGDALELAGAVLWAMHVVVVGLAARQVPVFLFSVGQYFVAGVLNLALGLLLEAASLPVLANCWWAVVYVGIVSVAIGYTLQVFGQVHAPAADAAVLLSMEAVFAAVFGYLALGETLTPRQLLGCALILAAILIVQFKNVEPPSP